MRNIAAAAVLSASVLTATEAWGETETRKIGEIEWHLDYDEALTVAREKQRPLWLHFGEHPG